MMVMLIGVFENIILINGDQTSLGLAIIILRRYPYLVNGFCAPYVHLPYLSRLLPTQLWVVELKVDS